MNAPPGFDAQPRQHLFLQTRTNTVSSCVSTSRSPLLLPCLLAASSLGLCGCLGTGIASREFDPGDWRPPSDAQACPADPDAFIGGDPDLYECPEYWVCEDLADGVKRCTNPGPDYPGGGDWQCRDEDGQTICQGPDYPDGGGGGEWNCEREGDLVTCRSDRPDYPDNGGGGPWNCHFWNEFRICDGGDRPDIPDDGEGFCFYPEEGPTTEVIVHGGYRLETRLGRETIHVALIFSEAFVDNSYGARSSDGYHRGRREHTFRDLVGSDHAEVGFEDASGAEVLRARFDYISESSEMTSGHDALGATDGDGRMISGDSAWIVDATSSLARNMNELGCVFTTDSPTDAECPGWDNRVVYEVWLDAAAFPDGFGGPVLESVHASPSRTENTVIVRRGECP